MNKPDTKEAILQAGHDLVIEKSYNGCGLKEILDRAGVPKGSFYHYFKSKEDFALALIERAQDENHDFMREFLRDRKHSPLQRIRNMFAQIQQFHRDEGLDCQCLIPKLALEQSQLSEPLRGAILCASELMHNNLAQTIREAQTEGEVTTAIDPLTVAAFIFNASHGASIQMQVERDTAPYDNFIEIVFNFILVP
jgi:TetR/AcrR family transcriptional repressor of nem operon